MKNFQKEAPRFEIRQVGIVVRNLEKTMQQMDSLLGIGPFRLLNLVQTDAIVHGKKTQCEAKLAFAQHGDIEIELMEPVKGESTWKEFLDAKGEGVHHFGIFIPDIDKELARYKERGIGVLHSGEDKFMKFAYMDTEAIVGVIIELLQAK